MTKKLTKPPARVFVRKFTVYLVPAGCSAIQDGAKLGLESKDVEHKFEVHSTIEAMADLLDWITVPKGKQIEVWLGLMLVWELNDSGIKVRHG